MGEVNKIAHCNEHGTIRGHLLFDVLQLTVVMPIELEDIMPPEGCNCQQRNLQT